MTTAQMSSDNMLAAPLISQTRSCYAAKDEKQRRFKMIHFQNCNVASIRAAIAVKFGISEEKIVSMFVDAGNDSLFEIETDEDLAENLFTRPLKVVFTTAS
jgi:hypothetical protein